MIGCDNCKFGDLDLSDDPCDICYDHNMYAPDENRQEESDDEFKKKLIYELHEINLSLRKLSGRDVTTNISDSTEPKSYKEKYFSRTAEDK